MGRMRSQLDDLIAQQAQLASDAGGSTEIAPPYQSGVVHPQNFQEQPVAPYPQASPYPPQSQTISPQPGMPLQYAQPVGTQVPPPQVAYPAGVVSGQTAENADISGIRSSLERLSAMLNDVTQNQKTLARSQSAAHAAAQAQANPMPNLEQEFAALRREIATLSSATANSAVGKEIFGSIKLIAEGMRQLQLLHGEQPEQFGQVSSSLQAIHSQLDQLNRTVPQSAVQVDLGPLQTDLDSNFAALGQRLEMMTSDNNQIGELTQAIDGSHADIVNRLHALAEHSPDDHISDMRIQLQSIGTTLAGLSQAGGNALKGDLGSIDERLDEITRGMVALSVNVNEGSNSEALERVEARVTTLAKTIDTYVTQEASKASVAKDSGQDNEVFHLLHGLTGHIDTLSEKIDSLSVVPVDSKGKQAAVVRNDDGIIKKLDELVSRMDDLQASGSGKSDSAGEDKQLAALEQQLGDIASHLNSTSGGKIDFSHLDERLDTIEQQVAVSRDIAIEVASKVAGQAANNAAIQAVNEAFDRVNIGGEQAAGPAFDTKVFGDIADDIRKLQDSSQSQNADNRQVFESVRGSLNTIITRLNDIEGFVSVAGEITTSSEHVVATEVDVSPQDVPTVAKERAQPSKKQARAPLAASENEVSVVDEVVAEAVAASKDDADHIVKSVRPDEPPYEVSSGQEIVPPSLDMEDLPEVGSSYLAGDAPLEPGSGGPDLAALVQQASKRKKEKPEAGEITGTDFIAAARRAAQAAALEANAVEADEKSKSKSKIKLSLSDFFAKRKKVVLMTAAAVLIAAMAVPIATAYLNGKDGDKVAGSVQPAEHSAILPVSPTIENAPVASPIADLDVSPGVGPSVGIDKKTVGSIKKDTVTAAGESAIKILKVPASTELMDKKMQTSGFAVENNKVDSSGFKVEKPMELASKIGTAITSAPMPPSNVGNIQLRAAAANGNLSALFEIGRIYTDGNGVERNLAEAAKWYRLAAERGYAPAQYRLGNFYEKAHGMPRDIDEAMVWYRLAAKQGNALAMHNLAVVTAMGTERAKADLGIAAKWFAKAAALGIKDSQVNLGILYTKGLGVGKDLAVAYKWFGVAALAGDSDASSKRDTVAGLMTPEQLGLARAEIELWKKTPIIDEANFVEIPKAWKGNALASGKQSKRDTIRDAQKLLSKLGFDAGPADGMMGAKTRNAVMAFQQRAGMNVDGIINTGLIAKLKGGAA